MRPIRTAARALIILDRRLLTIQMRDDSGIFYILPGGGQKHGETLQDSLKRECLEEIGTEIEIGELVYIREYIGKNHFFRKSHHAFHQVESVFRCSLPKPEEIGPGTETDKKQIGIKWLPLAELGSYRLLPETIVPFFNEEDFRPPQIYLGDVN
ncbi:MAG: NUDIX domain-containing protein [Verrucomicrobiota bacterium]